MSIYHRDYSQHANTNPSINLYKYKKVVYPNYRSRRVIFKSPDKSDYAFKSLHIDGVKYKSSIYTDRRSFHSKTEQILDLNYPFGGECKVDFVYKPKSKNPQNVSLSFYMQPSVPLVKAKLKNDGILLSWRKVFWDDSKFIVPPKLVLQRESRNYKTFDDHKTNSYFDKNFISGEPLSYNIRFTKARIKSSIWSPDKGTEDYACSYSAEYIRQDTGRINAPTPDSKGHPVKIELLKSRLYHENTGIAACRLLDRIINRIEKTEDMVFYDRDSRNYIIDKKLFALSEKLQKKFLMNEADYAILLNDYSRSYGNGVELWLFKKEIRGRSAFRDTIYWKVAEIDKSGSEADIEKAVCAMISKIKDSLEFKTCKDKRIKNIKPANVICSAFRPVNQKCLVWSYEAICGIPVPAAQ